MADIVKYAGHLHFSSTFFLVHILDTVNLEALVNFFFLVPPFHTLDPQASRGIPVTKLANYLPPTPTNTFCVPLILLFLLNECI